MLEHVRRHCMSAKVKVTRSVYQMIGQVGTGNLPNLNKLNNALVGSILI